LWQLHNNDNQDRTIPINDGISPEYGRNLFHGAVNEQLCAHIFDMNTNGSTTCSHCRESETIIYLPTISPQQFNHHGDVILVDLNIFESVVVRCV